MEDWWGPGIYDFAGFDIYQTAQASMLTDRWYQARAFAGSKGVPIAVGEWGMRGTDTAAGQRVHEWYESAINSYNDGRGGRVVGLSAFDSAQNSPDGAWTLTGAQLTAFHDLMRDPRTVSVEP
jgi:hypothetical protein